MDENVSAIDAAARSSHSTDSGLVSFVLLARLHGVAADAGQLKHQYLQGVERFDTTAMLRAAKQLGLKAKVISTSWERLNLASLPAIAKLHDGCFSLIGRATQSQVLVHNPATNRPDVLTKEQFLAAWTGELVLLTKRSLLPG